MTHTSASSHHHSTPQSGQSSTLPANEKLLPLTQVEIRTGFKSSFIYQLIGQGKFPKPIKIGMASRWRESEVQQWIQNQIDASATAERLGGRA